jgi:uncharacterized membrane protein
MTDATQPSRFSPRALRWALVASLALNVLIIGTVAGTLCFSRFGPGPGHWGQKGTGFLFGFARTLPRERSDMIRQRLADSKPNMETLRKGIRDARLEVRAALTAEPFDQAKLKAALEGVVQAEVNEQRAKVAVFGDTVGQLTPEERRQLHDWLEKRRPLN